MTIREDMTTDKYTTTHQERAFQMFGSRSAQNFKYAELKSMDGGLCVHLMAEEKVSC